MLEFAALAIFLGVKHSFDADHLIAVSNLLSKARSLSHSVKMSASWAAGHMLTAIIITALLFAFKDSFLPLLLGKMELLVALMLVALGLFGIWQSRLLHSHEHLHGHEQHTHWHAHSAGLSHGQDHSHKHMFGIGIVHGLASNDELLILLTATLGLSSFAEASLGLALFSTGVVAGMVFFSLLFTYPLLRAHSQKLVRAFNFSAGCMSVIYGGMMLFGL